MVTVVVVAAAAVVARQLASACLTSDWLEIAVDLNRNCYFVVTRANDLARDYYCCCCCHCDSNDADYDDYADDADDYLCCFGVDDGNGLVDDKC